MTQPPKPFTAAEIHAVYATLPTEKATPGENEASKYIRSPHFKREPNHPGRAPNKLDLTPGSRRK